MIGELAALNEAEKIMLKIIAAGAVVSIGILSWNLHTTYVTSNTVSSLKTKIVDQTSNTTQRLNRMQFAIDKLNDKVDSLESKK